MAQDVTAAHRLMLDLVASERRVALTAGNLAQVMAATKDAVVSVNRKWEFTYLNPAAEMLYGKASGLIGRSLWECFPDAVYEGSPFVEHYYRAMDQGKRPSRRQSPSRNYWKDSSSVNTAD